MKDFFENDNRHYLPAIKEWYNGIYSYNKNSLKDQFQKDEIANNLLRTHLHSSSIKDKIARSKRRRTLIRRSSTKRVYVSMPEIKHTSDKAIVSLYAFDRENDLLKKKFFKIKKFLKKTLTSGLNIPEFKLKLNNAGNIVLTNLRLRLRLAKKSRRKILIARNRVIKKYKLKSNLMYRQSAQYIENKNLNIKQWFLHLYTKWVLSMYGINISILCICKNCISRGKKQFNEVNTKCKKCGNLTKLNQKRKIKLVQDDFSINFKLLNNSLYQKRYFRFLKNILVTSLDISNDAMKSSFLFFCKLIYKRWSNTILKNEYEIIKRISKFQFNNIKFNVLLPYIKEYIANIYNKNIELNIIKLKYLHLSSDTLLESLTVKLRKKKVSLLRVIGRSLKLIKLPKEFSAVLQNDLEYEKNLNNIRFNILTSIKHKWIVGARLEAKGRLTRRYTASRALFKYVNKGNLKNHYNSYKKEFILNSPTVHMIRGQFKPNLQYTYYYSNKRIGTFGLKGWINTV